MDVKLEKIEVKDIRPIREIVYMNIREAILDGRFKEGDRLVETDISQAMGVSRTPVREALRQLEVEGLAVNIPRRGTIVKGLSIEDANQIYDIREVLEGLAARTACFNISRKNLLDLRQVVNQMDISIKTNDMNEYNKLHEQFNSIIINSCGNSKVIDYLENINEYLINLRRISLETMEGRKSALKEHEMILEALEKGDGNLAENRTREHIKNAKERFIHNKR